MALLVVVFYALSSRVAMGMATVRVVSEEGESLEPRPEVDAMLRFQRPADSSDCEALVQAVVGHMRSNMAAPVPRDAVSSNFLVRVRIAKSAIPNAGNGLFAGEDIAKGAVIWKEREILAIEPRCAHAVKRVASLGLRDKFMDWTHGEKPDLAVYEIDEDRYINDGQNGTANLKQCGPSSFWLCAALDIREGTELLEDYDGDHLDWPEWLVEALHD